MGEVQWWHYSRVTVGTLSDRLQIALIYGNLTWCRVSSLWNLKLKTYHQTSKVAIQLRPVILDPMFGQNPNGIYKYFFSASSLWSIQIIFTIFQVSIVPHNGLSPIWLQAIIWTSARLLLIGPLGTNFGEILSNIQNFSFTKMHLKISSAKRQPFCPGDDELSTISFIIKDQIYKLGLSLL